MPVDVSGLTSMLATIPGQNMANLQNTLEQAYRDKQTAQQQEFQNNLLSQQMHLKEQMSKGQLDLQKLETNAKQMQYVTDWAQGLSVTKDPVQRELYTKQGIMQAQQLGIPQEGQMAMVKAFQEPDFVNTLIARGVGTNEFYKSTLAANSNKDASQSQKKYDELVQRAHELGTYVPGQTERVAEGIAYGSYHTTADPTTGDIVITDVRSAGSRAPAAEVGQINPLGGVPTPDTNYSPKRIVSGNKQEMRIQDKVQDLSKEIKQTGILPAEAALQPIEATLADTFSKGKPVPGYGRLKSGLPTATLSWWDEEGKAFRQQVQTLMVIDIHQFAGSAQSAQELARIQQKYAAGLLNDPAQLVAAIRQFRAGIEESKKNTFAGYAPEIVDRYQKQGGINLQGGKKQEEGSVHSRKPKGPPTSAAEVRADAKTHNWDEAQIQSILKQWNLKE